MTQRRFNLRHPSKGRLQQWLETGQSDAVGQHVENCERCADLLVNVEPVFQLDVPTSFRQALSAALTPPADLTERVKHGIEQRSHTDRELALLAGMFTLGIDTAKLMVSDDAQHEHGPNPDEPPTTGASPR